MVPPRIIAPIAAVVLAFTALAGPVLARDAAGGPSTVCGDSDGNRIVNSIDVAIVLQYSAGYLHTLVYQANDDVDSSGTVDARDAALILQVAAHRIHIEALHCTQPPA